MRAHELGRRLLELADGEVFVERTRVRELAESQGIDRYNTAEVVVVLEVDWGD